MREVFTAAQALFDTAGCADPYPHYTTLREHAPILQLGAGVVAVSRYADCEQVMRDPVFRMEDIDWIGRTTPGWSDHHSFRSLMREMVNQNSPHHERLRRLVSRAFTPRRIAGLRPAVGQLVDDLLDRMASRGGVVDFMAEFAMPLPVTVIGELLGIPPEDRRWFAPRVEAFTAAIEASMTGPALDAADIAVAELWERLGLIVEERRRHPREDLVSALVSVADADADRLSPEELLSNLVLLYAAGYETTSNLLGNGLAALLAQPELIARLRADPDAVEGYVEEMLRFDPPIQVATRYAAEDTQIGGRLISADTHVVVLIGAANRDPSRFPRPEVFDPARAGGASLVFGIGAHYCLGAALARMEAQVAFRRLFERFDSVSFAGEPSPRRGTLRGFEHLPVKLA